MEMDGEFVWWFWEINLMLWYSSGFGGDEHWLRWLIWRFHYDENICNTTTYVLKYQPYEQETLPRIQPTTTRPTIDARSSMSVAGLCKVPTGRSVIRAVSVFESALFELGYAFSDTRSNVSLRTRSSTLSIITCLICLPASPWCGNTSGRRQLGYKLPWEVRCSTFEWCS